jgi:hypothetical protein
MNNLPLEKLVNQALNRLLSLSDEELRNRLERCKHSNLARVFADCSKFGETPAVDSSRQQVKRRQRTGQLKKLSFFKET